METNVWQQPDVLAQRSQHSKIGNSPVLYSQLIKINEQRANTLYCHD